MQLKEYFISQKEQTLNQNEKFFLYEKIISQKDKKSLGRTKHLINIKSFAYGFAIIILFVSIYGVYFINGDLSYEGFLVKNSINQVNADYIAKVVDFNGDFYIKHDGSYYKTSNISNGDNIILKKGSEVIFDINSGAKAKITGPAKFSLNLKDDNYQLLISQGDFIQITSETQQKQIDTKSIDVIINDIKVSSDRQMNFQITKEDDQYEINNQGEQLTITQAENTRELETKQLLTINNETEETIIIENIEDFGRAITQNNVSQVFSIENDTTEIKTKDDQIATTLLTDINPDNDEITNPKLAQDLGIIDNKQIPSTDQTKTLHSLLNNNFVIGNIEEIFKSYIIGDDKQYTYNQGLLDSRIQKIYNLFDFKYNNLNTIDSINTLKQQLIDEYHIPDKYTQNLDIIVSRIQYIQKNTYGSNTNIDQVDQLWNDLETNPPSYLILK